MTNEEQKLREIAYKHAEPKVIWNDGNMSIYPDEEKIKSLLSDLTALISEGYVNKDAYVALENTLAKAEVKNLELLQQRDELKEALVEMIWQFGYRGTYEGRENLHLSGLSALE